MAKLKSATCSTGHGTGVQMPRDLGARLKAPRRRLRLFPRVRPPRWARVRQKEAQERAEALDLARQDRARRKGELESLRSLEAPAPKPTSLSKVRKTFARKVL